MSAQQALVGALVAAYGTIGLLVGALVLLAKIVARMKRDAKSNGYLKPDEDYPVTRSELNRVVDVRIFHRRGADLALGRPVLEHLAKGYGVEALEAWDRGLCSARMSSSDGRDL